MMRSSSSSTPSTRVDWRARRIRSMLVARIGGPVVLWFGDFESNPSRARFFAPQNLPPDHPQRLHAAILSSSRSTKVSGEPHFSFCTGCYRRRERTSQSRQMSDVASVDLADDFTAVL